MTNRREWIEHLPRGRPGKFLVGVCRWDSETLNLYQTTSFQLYFRLDAKYPHPILSIFQKSSVQYSRIVFSMENRLSINKVAVIEFTFISEFLKPYFGLNFSRHCRSHWRSASNIPPLFFSGKLKPKKRQIVIFDRLSSSQ